MDFYGFENDAEEAVEETSAIPSRDAVGLESLQVHLKKAGEEIAIAKGLFRAHLQSRIEKDSELRWLEEADFDPTLLQKRGYLSKEFDEKFFSSLPKVHPEIKFKVTKDPNNQLLIKQLNDLEKTLRSINLTF